MYSIMKKKTLKQLILMFSNSSLSENFYRNVLGTNSYRPISSPYFEKIMIKKKINLINNKISRWILLSIKK